MNKIERFMKRNSSLILSIFSGIGVVTTTVLAIKATPKAIQLIEERKEETDTNKLTIKETIQTAWRPYIPTGISMFSTLICIFGNTYLNYRTRASLISAYAVLDRSYKEYVEKTKELYGNDADKNIRKKIASSNIYLNYIQKEDKKLFFEFQTMRQFESTIEDVIKAENRLNQELAATGCVSMNDFFKFLNLDPLPYADSVGWCDNGDYHPIEFYHEKTELDDGLECILINMDAWSMDFDRY